MSVPKLRFLEFQDALEWEEKKLGQISDIRTGPFGSVLHESDYVEIGTPIITVEHLDDLGIKGNNFPRVSDDDKVRLGSYQLKEGDIVFSRVGSVDRSSIIRTHESGWLFSGRLLRLRIKKLQENSAQFLSQLLKYEPSKVKIRDRAVGQTMPSLNTEILNSVAFHFPSLLEQQKIADCLTSLESVITAQSQKLEALGVHKRGLMQQLFPSEGETVPKLRFLEFQDAGDWEEKEIGEVFRVTRGDVLSMTLVQDIKSDEMQYPVYSSQTKNDGLAGFYSDYLYENAITWTTDGANAGDVNYRSGKFYCTNVCGVLINTSGYANPCVAALINNVSRKYVSYVGNPKLMNGVMSKIVIALPPLLEQQKIADCLTTLEQLITAQKQKLEMLKVHKKGLMQQLFPAPDEAQT